MKRLIAILLVLLFALPLASCGNVYTSRTARFYGEIDKSSFWFKAEIMTASDTYYYTQAVDSDSVTTIEDHDDDANDGYVIYDGKYMHQLNVKNKKYDTVKTDSGVKFLFGNNEYSDFNLPDDVTEQATFRGNTYYCESFNTIDDKGNAKGVNKYYYDGERLVGIEWYEGNGLVTLLTMDTYSNQIPEGIYTSIPADYKAGTFTAEQIIPPSETPGGSSNTSK